ncbi:hypothetical protein QCD71_06475 [Sphingomonas sp. PsM26]|nr:hypothetical protein [Sphingomonas sp. PsM26]
MKNLEAEESRLGKIIAATPAPQVVRLPANYEAMYIRAIAGLDVHLASEDGAAARNTIRPLIEKIVVQPSSSREGNRRLMPLHGYLYQVLSFAEASYEPNAQSPRLSGQGLL